MTQETLKSSAGKDFIISKYIKFLGEPKKTKRGSRHKCPNCEEYQLAIDKNGIKYDCHYCHKNTRIAFLLRQMNGEIPEKDNNSYYFSNSAKRDNNSKTFEPDKLPKAVKLNNFIKSTYTNLRYNDHSKEIWLGDKPFSKAVCKLELLSAHIADKYGKDYPKERCIDAVMLHAQRNPFNPLQSYLRACKQMFIEEVGKNIGDCFREASKTLSNLSSKYLHTRKELYNQYLKLFILSAVGRALSPGCYVRQVLILQGEQEIGKTSFFSTFGGEWFSNSLGDAKGKDELMIAIMHWILEWGELENIYGKKTIAEIKNFITKTKDDLRLPYGRSVESVNRSFVLCGSTNKTEFLTDETGNSRFWIIPITKGVDLIGWKEARNRVLGASCFLIDLELQTNPERIKNGDYWQLMEEFKQANKDNTKEFEEGDDWENILQPWLEHWKQDSNDYWVESKLVWQELGIETKDCRKYSNQISKVMTRLGWQRKSKTINGKTYRGWKLKR